jgi:cytochrome P450
LDAAGAETVVLPPRYANELKNDDRLSFTSLKAKGMHSTLPGFKAVGTLDQDNRIIQIVAQQDLTRSLPRLTPALSSECAVALKDAVGDGKEWHDVVVRRGISLPLVARLSTLAFMGRESCYDREWIDIVIDFTVNIMLATVALHAWPRWLRPLANYFIPECRVLRAQERRARDIIEEKLAARRKFRDKEADLGSGRETQPSNALDWFHSQHQRLGGQYLPAETQLMLSFGAIHTTADLLTQVVLDLALHRDLMEPLRREIVEALDGRPIDKAATQKMKLLDSVMKETQRLKPMQISESLAL